MGWDFGTIVDAARYDGFLDHITCPICYEGLEDAVYDSRCGHLFCQPCLLSWTQQHDTCPTCRTTLGSELVGVSSYMQAMIEAPIVCCPTCHATMPRGEMKHHACAAARDGACAAARDGAETAIAKHQALTAEYLDLGGELGRMRTEHDRALERLNGVPAVIEPPERALLAAAVARLAAHVDSGFSGGRIEDRAEELIKAYAWGEAYKILAASVYQARYAPRVLPRALALMATCLNALNRPRDAEKYGQYALELDPATPVPELEWATIGRRVRAHKRAADTGIGGACAIESDDAAIRLYIDLTLHVPTHLTAAAADRLVRMRPHCWRARVVRADVARTLRHKDECLSDLAAAVALSEGTAYQALWRCAICRLEDGDLEGALEDARRAVRQKGGAISPIAVMVRGHVFDVCGMPLEAFGDMHRASQLQEKFVGMRAHLVDDEMAGGNQYPMSDLWAGECDEIWPMTCAALIPHVIKDLKARIGWDDRLAPQVAPAPAADEYDEDDEDDEDDGDDEDDEDENGDIE